MTQPLFMGLRAVATFAAGDEGKDEKRQSINSSNITTVFTISGCFAPKKEIENLKEEKNHVQSSQRNEMNWMEWNRIELIFCLIVRNVKIIISRKYERWQNRATLWRFFTGPSNAVKRFPRRIGSKLPYRKSAQSLRRLTCVRAVHCMRK